MRTESAIYTAAAVLSIGWMLSPVNTHAARRNFNLSYNGDAASCADLKVTSRDGEVAKLTDSFTMSRAEAPTLQLTGTERSQIQVRGWDKADYSVETCKIAVAETKVAAEAMAKSVAVSHIGGRLTYTGPATNDDGQWQAVFLIHAPKDANVDLETTNGPISVRDMNGNVKVRAHNGPIAVTNTTGNVNAHTQNGPISFRGDRGEVHLTAQNGPISVQLPSADWNGPQLEARTINGPLSVSIPDNFRTGMRLDTDGHAPMSCNAAPCRNAMSDMQRSSRTIRFNGASDVVRLSTENGPVSISSGDRAKGRIF